MAEAAMVISYFALLVMGIAGIVLLVLVVAAIMGAASFILDSAGGPPDLGV